MTTRDVEQFVFAVVALVASAACAETPSRAPAGAATSAAGDGGAYTPGSIVLYLARRELVGACGDDLAQAIEFAPDAADVLPRQKVEIEKWALCLQRPELKKARVVLVPPDPAAGAAVLFDKRARLLQDQLVARGVAASRVSIGTPAASADPGGASPANAIRVEVIAADRTSP